MPTDTRQPGGKKAPSAPSMRERAQQRAQTARAHAHRAGHYAYAGHQATKGVQLQAAPPAAMGVLVLASAAVNAAQQSTGEDQAILLGTAATCVVIAVVAAYQLKQRLNDRRAALRGSLFVATCGAWLTETVALGLSWNAVAVLTVLGTVLSLHWWRRRRIPDLTPTPPTPPPMPVLPEPDVDLYAQMWADNLATTTDLAGSWLEGRAEIKAGWRYVLRLVPGKQSYGTVIGKLGSIISGLELKPAEDLIIERHPVLAASCLSVTIVTRSPIRQSVLHPGAAAFNPVTGCIDLGPYTDGEGVATWRLYTSNSMWGGVIIGGTGSGKSRLLDGIAMSAAASSTHPTVLWYLDGDEGASSALLARHADHKALDPEFEQARDMLGGGLLIMKLRRAENVANGWEGFNPTAERPGILIVIDECHLPFADAEIRAMAAEIARRGRKVGVAIIAASQLGTLDTFGGAGAPHSDALRSSLRAGNGVVLRMMTNSIKDVFKLDLDPSLFPDLPGYAYYVAAKGSDKRIAPFRGYYVTDQLKDQWPGQITWRSLGRDEANVYGVDYLNRNEIAAQSREEALAWIAAMKSGTATEADRGLRKIAPQPEGQVFAGVPQIPVWDPAKFAPARKVRPRDELHRSHAAVLAALAGGAQQPKDIATAVELGERQVNNLLNELIDDFQLVRKADYGKYELRPEAAQPA